MHFSRKARSSSRRGVYGFRAIIVENQMEKSMENEMEMRLIWRFIGLRTLYEL